MDGRRVTPQVAPRQCGGCLRFHDLRRTFGTEVIGNPRVSILQLKAWMGHADIDTTMTCLHFAPRSADADLIAEAFDAAMVARAPDQAPVGPGA